ncbi:hypothetical protein DDZ13_03785 [Coraliomargarita sinensis]|uniref:Ice-binding protein C-terminal domain-containing protein n=1 Tax=Coraliomargarita sinensis TaxID=2174842 RepID=A0A317ZHP4_9BACT|nr:PEP-CTERM sorting domain-containing protein [Coraliomargarita sinensis]PXA05095.1 hypothetical protein DDZ13_03785 [Coraliomargarita sinensis]
MRHLQLPLSLLAGSLSINAATVTSTTSAPTIDGADIAMYTITDTDFGTSRLNGDRSARGQTFTTGSNSTGYLLSSFTLQSAETFTPNGFQDGEYQLRVGTLSGSTFTAIADETTPLDTGFAYTDTHYITFSFDTSVLLAANTLYAIDVNKLDGQGFQSYRNTDDSSYTGGTAYSGSNTGSSTSDTVNTHGHDRVFHVDLAAAPIPEPSSLWLSAFAALSLMLRRRR